MIEVMNETKVNMRAMRIHRLGAINSANPPLEQVFIPVPQPGESDLLIRVHACGVCHTEIDEIEGRTPPSSLPMTPGHQVIGKVVGQGPACTMGLVNKRVGIAWIHSACGECQWCLGGRENLCPDFIACGRDAPGGYAEYMTVPEAFAHIIPDELGDLEATPLLCAGAVGYRALSLCRLENGQNLGLTGFGASGHLVLQMAQHLYPNSRLFVFARSETERAFSAEMGATWTGSTTERPATGLDAIIDTTPAWLPVLAAMEALAPGGRLVINAIRKESADHDILATLNYDKHLWREKSLRTVANVTRSDVQECLRLATDIPLRPHITAYPLENANQALLEMKQGQIRGAKVLQII
jgi:propanol-preferring alcohol dehydrogenase